MEKEKRIEKRSARSRIVKQVLLTVQNKQLSKYSIRALFALNFVQLDNKVEYLLVFGTDKSILPSVDDLSTQLFKDDSS